METAISTRKLSKTFVTRTKKAGLRGSVESILHPSLHQVEAVESIDIDVKVGEVVAFIGPNGAGKSTTIKMLTGILFPTSGDAKVLGLTPWLDRHKLSFRIGSVFGQKSQLWYHLPPTDTFNLLARIYELDQSKYRERRGLLVEAFDIGEFLEIPVRKLSLGQRMRCEIAASLLHEPEVVFLDEPTIGLDVVARQNVRQYLKAWNSQEKTTVFLTSHDTGDIEYLAERVIILNHGQVVLDDRVKSIKYQYMRKKVVDVKLAREAPSIVFPGVTVVKATKIGLKLEVDLDAVPIGQAISSVLHDCEVLDISISDPPLEDIIAAIYAAGDEGDEVKRAPSEGAV